MTPSRPRRPVPASGNAENETSTPPPPVGEPVAPPPASAPMPSMAGTPLKTMAPELAGQQNMSPQAPQTYNPAMAQEPSVSAATTGGKYANAGVITSINIIHGNMDDYTWLDEKVLEVTAWVQQALVTQDRADDIDKARRDPHLRAEISEEIDRLALQYILKERGIRGDAGKILIASVVNDIVGLGPLEPLWQDPNITEVIVNGPNDVYVEQSGKLIKAKACRFRSQEHLLEVCQRILIPLNRKVDVRDPLADGRLPDGSRVNVVHQSLAPKGPLLTIRRFPENNRSLVDLVGIGSLDPEMATLIATLIERRSSVLVVGGTGSGKSIDISTNVPTPTGFKRMGDLQVGDLVFDENGQPTAVIGAYDIQYDRPCFEVVFSDGSVIVADAEHLWLTETRSARRARERAKNSTGHTRKTALSKHELAKVAKLAAAIPSDAAVSVGDLAEACGWTTDGEKDRWYQATHGKAVVGLRESQKVTERAEKLYLAGDVIGPAFERWSRPWYDQQDLSETAQVRTTEQIRESLRVGAGNYTNHSVRVALPVQTDEVELPVPPRVLGLWLGDGLEDDGRFCNAGVFDSKHIPDTYLFASESQRRELLSGLLDASGGVCKDSGKVEFYNSDERLARQVLSLVSSLGYKATFRSDTAFYQGKDCGLTFTVAFQGQGDEFKLPIKRKAWMTSRVGKGRQADRNDLRYIVDVRPVPSRPVRCIRVASPSHLFLVGETFIPTHNTTLLNALSVAIPLHERVVTIEDSLELRLNPESHVAAMEARPPDATGQNAVSIRQLVKNALRMRPDRIIVGEIRDSAALDMLQACNTGHEGSMSTVHANGPDEAISRLTVMVAQGGEIPAEKVDWLISSAIDIIVMSRRYEDGSRRVSGIYEVPDVTQIAEGGSLRTIPLWEWEQTGTDADGKLQGHYVKRNDISDHLRKAKKLDLGRTYTWETLVELCQPKQNTQPVGFTGRSS